MLESRTFEYFGMLLPVAARETCDLRLCAVPVDLTNQQHELNHTPRCALSAVILGPHILPVSRI